MHQMLIYDLNFVMGGNRGTRGIQMPTPCWLVNGVTCCQISPTGRPRTWLYSGNEILLDGRVRLFHAAALRLKNRRR